MVIPADRPVVLAFSTSPLRHVFESVAPLLADRAEVRVFAKGFEEALTTVRTLVQSGERVDALVAAGSNGAYLRDHADLPVVVVTASTVDALGAVIQARKLSRRIGVVNFRNIVPGLEEAKWLLGATDLEQRAYLTPEDARAHVADLAGRGFEVVIGPGPVCTLAEQAGLSSVLLYGQDSLVEAIRQAAEIATIARREAARRDLLQRALDHLEPGVVAVDLEERIVSVNPSLERLLGAGAAELMGKRLTSVAPELRLARVLETGRLDLDDVVQLGHRTLVVNRTPLRVHGALVGAVLTCQDAAAVQRMERSLRSQHRPRRFVTRHALAGLTGTSAALAQVRALAERYARTDATVLVTGESGTGKELVAQGIHAASRRRDQPFVAINCAAFPETLLEGELFGHEEGAFTGSRRGGRPGLFEAAHLGTLFLDEVGDVPVTLQTRLLRVLQERQVLRLGSNEPTPIDVRVIAATHRDLRAAIARGQFREDLYFRLHILPLHLPPLRERPEDVPAIAAELLRKALARHGASAFLARALSLLLPRLGGYAWPGNVRELENVVERVALLFGDEAAGVAVDGEALRAVMPELTAGRRLPASGVATPPAGPEAEPAGARAGERPGGLRAARRSQERILVGQVVAECGGNLSEAARRLGIGRTTLYRKLGGAGFHG
jgi:propionate catabolism operon transcriptional regulator